MAEGSLALEHLVLLLCGLTDDLGKKRSPVQTSAGGRMEPQFWAAPQLQCSKTPSPSWKRLEPAQLVVGTWLTASQTHPVAPPPVGKGTRQMAHLPIPGLDGLDHHCLLGMDLRTPLLRACFCNRCDHLLSLTKSRPGPLQGLGVHLWFHGMEPRSLLPLQDGPIISSPRLYNLSLSPASSRWLYRRWGQSHG